MFLVSVFSDNNLNSKVEVQNQVILFTPESQSNPGVSSCGYTILVSGYHNAYEQISNSYYILSVMSFKMIHDDPNMMSFIINHFHLLTLNFKFWKQLGFQNSRYIYLLYLSLWPNYASDFLILISTPKFQCETSKTLYSRVLLQTQIFILWMYWIGYFIYQLVCIEVN